MDGGLIVFLVLTTLIVFGFVATMRFLEVYKQTRLGDGGAGNSLGTGELRGLIQEAVFDSIQPLEERLDRMETSLRQLPSARDGSKALPGPEHDGDQDR